MEEINSILLKQEIQYDEYKKLKYEEKIKKYKKNLIFIILN